MELPRSGNNYAQFTRIYDNYRYKYAKKHVPRYITTSMSVIVLVTYLLCLLILVSVHRNACALSGSCRTNGVLTSINLSEYPSKANTAEL